MVVVVGDCLQEQRAQLLRRLWWGGPTPAGREALYSVVAPVEGRLIFTQGSCRLVRIHAPCGGKARRSASLTRGESANVMSLDFTRFTQLRVTIHVRSRNPFILT